MWIHISTVCVGAVLVAQTTRLGPPHRPHQKLRKPKKIRHLRDFWLPVSWGCVAFVAACLRSFLKAATVRAIRQGRCSGCSLTLSIVDPGDHSARTDGASRVFHPLRSGASGRSAKGRSATRSESQRRRRRTRWDGHPAWGSKLRPYPALPKGASAKRRRGREERRRKPRPQ